MVKNESALLENLSSIGQHISQLPVTPDPGDLAPRGAELTCINPHRHTVKNNYNKKENGYNFWCLA